MVDGNNKTATRRRERGETVEGGGGDGRRLAMIAGEGRGIVVVRWKRDLVKTNVNLLTSNKSQPLNNFLPHVIHQDPKWTKWSIW